MTATQILDFICNNHIPKYGNYQLYKHESIYYEFVSDGIFVISLNLTDRRLYVYFRDKRFIENLSDMIPSIMFIHKKNIYYFDVNHLSDIDKSLVLIYAVKFFELYNEKSKIDI